MPLTKRHKRRLKELSRMIDSTMTIKDGMVEINLEYAMEIQEILQQIKSPKQKQGSETMDLDESTALSTEIREEEPSDSKKTDTDTGEHQTDANYEPPPKHVDNVPAWAKALWKKIAMKCHPDRLNFQDLTAIEIAKRQQYMLDSRSVYEQGDWKKLLYIGVQLDEFVDDLASSEQFNMLESEYNEITNKVNSVQSSLAWKWGNNWENFDLRIKILIACCNNHGIAPPSRDELMKIIIKFESE